MATILLVDDDPNTRVVLNTVLGNTVLGDELGHSVVFAPDGEAAILRYNRVRPELVITDLVMPNVYGLSLIREVKSMGAPARIIAISGKVPEGLERAKEAGVGVARPKPLEREALVSAVDAALASLDAEDGMD